MADNPRVSIPSGKKRSSGFAVESRWRDQLTLSAYFLNPGKATFASNAGQMDVVNLINSSEYISTNQGSPLEVDGGVFWKHLHAASSFGPYSRGSTDAQRHLETFQAFERSVKKKGFMTFDIETLGDNVTGQGFHITEISLSGMKRTRAGYEEAKTISKAMVIAPNKDIQDTYAKLISTFREDATAFEKFSSAEKRSLIDLMRYSMNQDGGIRLATNILDAKDGLVEHSAVLDHYKLSTKNIDDKLLMRQDLHPVFATHMESGLANLKHGISANRAISTFNRIVEREGAKGKFFVTKNGDFFDLPALQKFGELNNLQVSEIQNHLDWFKLQTTVFPDAARLHSQIGGRDVDLMAFEEGGWTLHEDRRTFNLTTQGAHAAAMDTGKYGLGGVVGQSIEAMSRVIQDAFGKPFDPTRSEFSFSDSPYRIGDVLFAPSGVRNYADKMDFMAEIVEGEDGITRYNPVGFGNTVVNAESFYQVMGARQFNKDGVPHLSVELRNVDTETSTFVTRSGKNARTEIAEFLQRTFVGGEAYSSEERTRIKDLQEHDRARRRYNQMFNLEQGATKGFKAARRMYANAALVKAAGGVDALDSVMDKLDFRSLWNGKEMVDNEDERRAFSRMLPRLLSEVDVYKPAIDEINKIGDDKPSELVRKSIALRAFNRQVEELNIDGKQLGKHIETRETLDYERRAVQFRDRLSHKENIVRINFQSMDKAVGSMMAYVTADNKKWEENPARRQEIMRHRLRAMIDGIADAGYWTDWSIKDEHQRQEAVRNITAAFREMDWNRKQAVSDTVRQVAENLMTSNSIIQGSIQTESLASRDVLNLIDSDIVHTLTQQAVRHGQAVRVSGFNAYFDADTILGSRLKELDGGSNLHAAPFADFTGMIAGRLKNQGMAMAVTMNDEGTMMALNIFKHDQTAGVLNQLEQGLTPKNALQIRLPLLQKNGTMVINNRQLNTKQYYVYDPKVSGDHPYRMMSSVEKVVNSYRDLFSQKKFMDRLKAGEWNKVQYSADRQLNDIVEDFSGRKRNIDTSDQAFFRNNFVDTLRSSAINVESAAIHALWKQGHLFENPKEVYNKRGKPRTINPNIKKSAFDSRGLKSDVTINDLELDGQDVLRRHIVNWAEEEAKAGRLPKLFLNAVKGDHWTKEPQLNQIDIRSLYPFGRYTNQGRDNAIQAFNVYSLDGETQDKIAGLNNKDLYVNMNDMTTTTAFYKHMSNLAKDAAADGRRGDKIGAHIKVAYMSEDQLQARLKAMSKTEEGLRLLVEEGIIKGSNLKTKELIWDPIRMPTLYEQQAMLQKDLVDSFKAYEQKFFEKPLNLEWDESLLDENGNIRAGATVKHGQLLGYIDGDKSKPFYHQFAKDKELAAELIANADNKRYGIRLTEQIHKFFLDIEKLTPAGGNSRYSSRFLQALTGVEGIGAIYNPDIGKHGDVGALIRAQSNKIVDFINNSADAETIASKANQAGLGVTLRRNPETGQYVAFDNNKNVTLSAIQKFMKDNGIAETVRGSSQYGLDEFETTWGIQELRGAQVRKYDKVVAEGLAEGVTLGPKEMDIFKRKGADMSAEYIWNQVTSQGKNTGRLGEAQGMVNALRSMVRNLDAPEIGFNQFAPIIEGERYSSVGTVDKTILDSDYVRSLIGKDAASKHQGFYLKLPEVGGNQLRLQVGDNMNADRVFIPLINQQGQGNDVWKQQIQRMISDIYKQADAVVQSGASSFQDEKARLQEFLHGYHNQLRSDVTSSNGAVYKNLLKTSMPQSASGIMKIIPPEFSQALGEELTYISENDARKLGVFDKLSKGQDLFVSNLRYPSFHTEAIQISKLRMSSEVEDGDHHITSMIAKMLRGDSDGDYNHIFVMDDGKGAEGVQGELARLYTNQTQEHLKRYNSVAQKASALAWAEQNGVSLDDWTRLHYHNLHSKNYDIQDDGTHIQKTFRFDLEAFAKDNNFTIPDANSADEILAKSGKAIVGQASNINAKLRQIGMEFISNEDQRLTLEMFGEFLEQKLISAKHGVGGGDALLHEKTGAAQFLSAIGSGNWSAAVRIDEKHELGFARDYKLLEAAGIMQNLQEVLGEEHRNILNHASTKFGLSSGAGELGDKAMSTEQLVSIIEGNDPGAMHGNQALNMVQRLAGTDQSLIDQFYARVREGMAMRDIQPLAVAGQEAAESTASEVIQNAGYVRSLDIPLDGENAPTSYVERGIGRMGDMFSEFMHSGAGKTAGIMGLAAVGGLALFNGMSGGHNLLPENSAAMGDGNEMRQHEPVQQQQTVRLEDNNSAMAGLRVQVRGQAPGGLSNQDIGNMTGDAILNSGIQANINVRSQDDTSTINREWMTSQFTNILSSGYTNG